MRILILAALAALPTPVLAADGEATARVAYGDLDLATRRGRASLDRRIGDAVRTMCRSDSERPLATQMAVARCRRLATETAALQRDHIVVAAYRAPVESAAR